MSTSKLYLFCLLAVLLISMPGCVKNSSNALEGEICDANRTTVIVANDLTGQLGYNNDIGKWVINVSIPGTTDGLRTCIVCGNIPGGLTVQGTTVVFSGELKDSNGYPRPQLGGQEIYYVRPTKLKKS